MSVPSYLRTLARNWWVLLASLLVGLAAAAGYLLAVPPTYIAHTQLLVSVRGDPEVPLDLNANAAYLSRQMPTFQRLPGSSLVLSQVVARLGLSESAAELGRSIVVATPPEGATTLDIAVKQPTGLRAQQVADGVADVLPGVISRLEDPSGRGRGRVKATLSEAAEVPADRTSPQIPGTLLAAGLVGLAAGLVIVALRYQRTLTISTPNDVLELTGSRPLANVPRDRTRDRRVLLRTFDDPTDPRAAAWATAFRELQRVVTSTGPRAPGTIVAVVSAGPAEGRTTIAAHLAHILASTGRSVVLVDADLADPDVRLVFGLEDQPGLSDVLRSRIALGDALEELGSPPLAVLTAGHYADDAMELIDTDAMAATVSNLAGWFDHVVIDGQSLLDNSLGIALAGIADSVLVVASRRRTARLTLARALAELQLVQVPVLGVVLNRVPAPNSRRFTGRRGYADRDSGPSDRAIEGAL